MSMDEYPLYDLEEPNLTGEERELYDAVSMDEAWALVEEFSTLTRVSGSADERRAAEYIASRLDALGIPHDVYDPELWLSIPNDASIRVVSPVEETLGEDGETPSIKTVSFSRDGTVAGEVVYVERSDVEIMAEIGDDIDEDVDGKVILLESVGLSIEAVQELQTLGAVGCVLIHPHEDEPHDGIASPIWGAMPRPDRTDALPDVVIANVSRTVGERLKALAEGSAPLELEVTADVTTDFFECPVVVARIRASETGPSDEFVLLHAHYDSWHVGVTDNATGDAGNLECARLFDEFSDELERDLWVAWWPAHSTGRYAGSAWFADEFALDLVERCIAHVNMDSPGSKDATEFDEMLAWMPEVDALCRDAIRDVAGKESRENRPRRSGDQSFDNIGVTTMLGLFSNVPEEVREARGYHSVRGSGGNSNAWHLTTDTLDKADPDVLERDVRVYATILARLLFAEVVPLDFRATVARHREVVEGYAARAEGHLDLEPVLAELAELDAAVDRFYDGLDDLPPETANEVLLDLSRPLVRLNFTSEGQFEQDPAVYRPPYPRLAPIDDLEGLPSDEYRFSLTHLKRARNGIVYELRRARRAVLDRLPE